MIDEVKYILKISPYLERFKEMGGGNYNFRCFLCGDGITGFKHRGWFLLKDTYSYYCHNCSASMSLGSFLELQFPEIYKEYVLEKLHHKGFDKQIKFKTDKRKNTIDYKTHDIIKRLLMPLSSNEDALEYIKKRKLPDKDIFVINNFKDLNLVEKYKATNFIEEPRIVLPIYTSNGIIGGIISRAIYKTSIRRYINLQFSDSPSVFGLYNTLGEYKINLNKKIYCVEGAFDSLLIDNAIAACTSDLLRVKRAFSDNLLRHLDIIYAPDNDRRNKEIIKLYEKIIKAGENIVILPPSIKEKDINDIVLHEKHVSDIMLLLKENTYKGISASLKLSHWKKA